MKTKVVLVAIISLTIAFSALIIYFITKYPETHEMIKNKAEAFDTSKINDCENIMLQQDLTYALCTEKEGKIVLKKDTEFYPGEYFGLQVNLQKLQIPFDSYYACTYGDFPIYETAYPSKYGETKPGLYYPYVFCSNLFNKNDYHHLAWSGFVLDKKGSFTIARIWVFNGSYPSSFDFKNNLNLGSLIFELVGEIK